MTKILNTRILASLGMIVFVAALAIGGTGAFFSDTETSTGNTFTAGELDLKIDNSSYGFDWNRPGAVNPTGVWGPNEANSWELSDLTNQLFFSFDDLKPGDYGEDTISMHVQNDAWACMALDLTSTPDNGINDPEGDAGDVTDGADGGELQNFLSFIFWRDDGDNVLETGEDVIEELSGLPGSIFTGEFFPIAEGGDLPLQAGTTTYIGKGWCFGTMTPDPEAPAANPNGPTPGNTGFTCDGSGDHNVAQSDGIVVDVEFYSEQARHNSEFQCPRPEQPIVTRLTLEKSINQDQTNPVTESLWTLTASSTNTLTIISGAETDPAVSSAPVTAGTYVLSETVVAGFTQTGLVCGGNATPLAGNVLTIASGEQVVCTFTNTEDTLQ